MDKPLTPEQYLNSFISTLEPHYTKLSTKYAGLHTTDSNNVSRPDEMYACIFAGKYANTHNLDLKTVLTQQSQGQSAILSFDNLKPVLSACIQVYAYNLALEDVLAPETLTHGVVKGILEAIKRNAPSIARRSYQPTADLAEALYNKLLSHTHGFATVLPLPEAKPLTKKAIQAKVKELTHRESVPEGDILPFDQTIPLAKVMHDILVGTKRSAKQALPTLEALEAVENEDETEKEKKARERLIRKLKRTLALPVTPADTITAYTEVLSANPDPDTLTPVNITTIKDIAYALIGRACTPYLLNGDLVIHDKTDNLYYKVLPTIGEENYTAYGFRLCNFQNLSSRIYRQQKLLETSPKYKDYYADPYGTGNIDPATVSYEDLGHIKYQPLPQGNPEERQKVLSELEEWDKELTYRINDIFDDPYNSRHDAKAQAEYRQSVNPLQYFYPEILFITAHKLAAYVYYPQEYSDLILRKPLDPLTGEPVIYHVHHVGGKGTEHDNSKENLRIITKQLNDELRYTSRPVIYKDTRYLTIKSYCDRTSAGSDSALNTAIKSLSTGDQVTFKKRVYTLDPDTNDILATDDPTARRYIYGDKVYDELVDFTNAHRLGKQYPTIQKGIRRAELAGKPEYKHKRHRFYLEGKDVIIKRI